MINSINYNNYNSVNQDVTYIRQPNDKEDTTVGYANDGMTEKDRVKKKVLDEYYKKMNQTNKSHSNPKAYIADKYINSWSSSFRNDMTEEERNIAYRSEMLMLNSNGSSHLNSSNDYALRGYDGIYGGYAKEMEKECQYARNVVNEQVQNLFEKNGIQLQDGVHLTFTVNPYDFTLKADGNVEKAVLDLIEKVLNKGNNAKNIWSHANQCMRDRNNEVINSQITEEKSSKFSVWWEIKNTTGYDIRELTAQNGTFYTADGKDLSEVYKGVAYNKDVANYYLSYLKKYSNEGFTNSDDLELTIGYNNNGFYDIGQEKGYGYGQDGWIANSSSGNENYFDVRV